MADPEHLEILKQGAEVWNRWREEYPEIVPDLNDETLNGMTLNEINFTKTELRRTRLYKTDLINANLTNANLYASILNRADLSRSNLTMAYLHSASLAQASLDGSFLRSTFLIWANLSQASLRGTVFRHTILGYTSLIDINLSEVIGVESCQYAFPSYVDYFTLKKSKNLPLDFLRGCGLPDILINYIPSIISDPYQFYSCFISHSSKDQDFVNRLHADLQNKGVRCWFAPEDLKIGAEIRTGIDESILLHDKLLLVISETSIKSPWVQQEVETALAREREQGRTVLFPIRLDDTVMQIKTGWPAYLKNTRNIGDFTRWENHNSYQKAFDRLLRDLKAEEETISS